MAHVLGKLCILYYFAIKRRLNPAATPLESPFGSSAGQKSLMFHVEMPKGRKGIIKFAFASVPTSSKEHIPPKGKRKIIDLKIPLERGIC